uniref:GG19853 n=1 Tax=Drosophila erecta TaxID=7220 RepID=B3P3Z2_DROER
MPIAHGRGRVDVAVDVDVEDEDEDEDENEDGQQDLQLDLDWHLDGLARLFAQQNLRYQNEEESQRDIECCLSVCLDFGGLEGSEDSGNGGVSGALRCLFVN